MPYIQFGGLDTGRHFGPVVSLAPSRSRYEPSDAARAFLEHAADFAAGRLAVFDPRYLDNPAALLPAALEAAARAVGLGRLAEVPPGEAAALTAALNRRFVDVGITARDVEAGLLEVAGGGVALR